MKAKSIIFLFLLFSNLLSAQFYVELSLDTESIYTVSLRSEIELGNQLQVGDGQITIIAPFGGFEIGELTSVKGKWVNVANFGKEEDATLEYDYFVIGLQNLEQLIDTDKLEVCEEIVLFKFKNIGVATDLVRLITLDDPLITRENPDLKLVVNAQNYFGVFDESTGRAHKISGIYEEGSIICDPLEMTPIDSMIPISGDTLDSPPLDTFADLDLDPQFDLEIVLTADNRYEVTLFPTSDFPDNFVWSGRVTLKVPIGGFLADNLISHRGDWRLRNKITTGGDDPNDYYRFIMEGTANKFTNNDAIPLFSFENAGKCTGPVEVMGNSTPDEEPNDFFRSSIFIQQNEDTFHFSKINIINKWKANCLPLTSDPDVGFEFHLYQAPDGLFVMSLISLDTFREISLVDARFTLAFPKGGLMIEDFESYDTNWQTEFVEGGTYGLNFDYLSFRLMDVDPQFEEHFNAVNFSSGDIIELFTFRNAEPCKGSITLIQVNDPILSTEKDYLGHQLTVFHHEKSLNLSAFKGLDENYQEIDCPELEDIKIEPEMDLAEDNKAIISWGSIPNAVAYDFHIRRVDDTEWAQRKLVKQPFIFAYLPLDNDYEYQIIIHLEDGSLHMSDIFPISINLIREE